MVAHPEIVKSGHRMTGEVSTKSSAAPVRLASNGRFLVSATSQHNTAKILTASTATKG